LMQRNLCKNANLCEEEVIAIVLYTGPMFQVYNTILRRYPKDKFEIFEKGNNLFSTTIFVLVSAVQKMCRVTRIPLGTIIYRGLGGKVDLPDIFFQVDCYGCSGYAEWGFLSTTSDRDVALGYSGVKERRPKAMVMVIETSSIDRGADISEFSQYPGEKEFLYLPCSFVQRAQQGASLVQFVDGGLVTFVPVKVNLNLKTETVEEQKERKKRMHLVSMHAVVEEVRYDLFEWSKSAEAAARLQQDKPSDKPITPVTTLVQNIMSQCEDVVKRHKMATWEEYVDDGTFLALASDMRDTKAWAKEKKELWMQDVSQNIDRLLDRSLLECHLLFQSFLQKVIDTTAAGSSERSTASFQLLLSRGIMMQGLNADANKCNKDGFSPIYVAAQNNQADLITLLAYAGGDVNKCDTDGISPVLVAASKNHTDCITQLLAAGGDVNKCDNNGVSPIFVAALKGYADLITQLVAAGGNVNKCDNDGVSPILIATMKGHTDCVTQLVAAGGDVNKCDNDGQSPASLTLDNAMNSVIHNGFVYMTLAGNSSQSNQLRSKYKRFYFLNDAWHISPKTPDTLHVCGAHPWSTPALIFADDSAYFTALPQMANWPGYLRIHDVSCSGMVGISDTDAAVYWTYCFNPESRFSNSAGLNKTRFDQYDIKWHGNFECDMLSCMGACGGSCCGSTCISPSGTAYKWRPDVLIRRKIS
jgi:ankyrin repeat protein